MSTPKKYKNPFILLIKKPNKHYRNFVKFATKKGKKETIEIIFKKSLYNVAKTNKTQFWNVVNTAVENTTIPLNVKVKRRGSKNIYIPIQIKKKYKKFLSYNWILKSAQKRHETKFSKKFINEIIETAENKSLASKKKREIYNLIEDNISNI